MSKKRILGLGLWFVVCLAAAHFYFNGRQKVATYEIDNPSYFEQAYNWYYDVDMSKHHPIIKIVNQNQKGGYCSAFIVSDTAALTAGHCMDFTKEDLRAHRGQALLLVQDRVLQLENLLLYLENNCPVLDPRCQQKLEQTQYLLDEAYAAKEILETQKADTYKVLNIYGEDTGVTATAYSKDKRMDYGWLEGDFKNFRKLPMRQKWKVKIGDTLRACGFYGGRLPPVCTDFKALGNYGFHYAGEGVLIPGVSGGPVIDYLGFVVGIASSVNDDFVVMVPTLGIIDILTPEQVKKHEKRNKSR